MRELDILYCLLCSLIFLNKQRAIIAASWGSDEVSEMKWTLKFSTKIFIIESSTTKGILKFDGKWGRGKPKATICISHSEGKSVSEVNLPISKQGMNFKGIFQIICGRPESNSSISQPQDKRLFEEDFIFKKIHEFIYFGSIISPEKSLGLDFPMQLGVSRL